MSQTADTVLEIATEYLGPAARTLLERQTRFHMNGLQYNDIGPEHCVDLAKWVKIASAMFIETESADELAARISGIR